MNDEWIRAWPNVKCQLYNGGSSDHVGLLVQLCENVLVHSPFRFINSWMEVMGTTMSRSRHAWDLPQLGGSSYVLTGKLKVVKTEMKTWLKNIGSLKSQIQMASKTLQDLGPLLAADLLNEDLLER